VALGLACWVLLRERPVADGLPMRPRFDRTVVVSGLLSVLRNRDTWPVVCANFGICGSFFAFAGVWATPYLTQVHAMERSTAAQHASLYFGGFALGCLFIGALSDRLGPARCPIVSAGANRYLSSAVICMPCSGFSG